MEQKLTDTIANTSSGMLKNDLSDESSWDLPLTTIIKNLEIFEEKLSDKLFCMIVVNMFLILICI